MPNSWKQLTSPREAGPRSPESGRPANYHVTILLISFATLLLEISYTRIVSYKLYYYYTYLVIGLALLGLGSGGVMVAVSQKLRQATTERILRAGLLLGALSVLIGYTIIAWLPIRTMAIWNYGTSESYTNFVKLVVLCLALFSAFIAVGVMLATLFGRRSDQIGKLYFFDLIGAAVACAIAVPLISWVGPPTIVFLAGAILGLTGLQYAVAKISGAVLGGISLIAVALVTVAGPSVIPDIQVDDDKADLSEIDETRWSPVFRVDSGSFFDAHQILYHDGLAGSVILEWDGDPASLEEYAFDRDPRAIPFETTATPPESVMIIGAAGGHEVLASINFGATTIDAVELNPATYDLVTGEYADFAGHFFDQPGVNYVTADGRAYLARSDDTYDLIWYPAPDTYAASNVAAAGAFVLSESYLFTSDTVKETLEHLSADGILAAQFGELNYDLRSNRTIRYVSTVRQALDDIGIEDARRHILVASTADASFPSLRYSTVLVKATPFTEEEMLRFARFPRTLPNTRLEHIPGELLANPVSTILALDDSALDEWYSDYKYDVSPIDDNAPFFWHFARFSDVLRDISEPIHPSFVDPEEGVGERVLLLLLVLAVLFAAVFLLLPFVLVRDVWTALPRKGTSGLYFSALGLGFMFFEITMIQKLVLFLGYPTYSLTVTLASLLVFTGVGALLSNRLRNIARDAKRFILPGLVALTAAYLFVLPSITDGLLSSPLALRFIVAFVVVAPLGVCLGMFMPLGVRSVANLSPHPTEYVAWGWAVNGFASVVGSVLTTVFAMTFGFNAVLVFGLVIYLCAVGALRFLSTPTTPVATTAVEPVVALTVGTSTVA